MEARFVIHTSRDPGGKKWWAQIKDKPETKLSGKTLAEAVGRLVAAKAYRLGIQLVSVEFTPAKS